MDQVNVQVPATVREGCAVPIQVWYGVSYGGLLQVLSQPVTIAIMQGGGPCADPPSAGYGQITWQKIVNTTELSAVTETDMVTAALQASPGMLAPPAPVYIDGCPPPTGICDVGPKKWMDQVARGIDVGTPELILPYTTSRTELP